MFLSAPGFSCRNIPGCCKIGFVEPSRIKSNKNEKPAFAKASADAVEPRRIKSNNFMKGMKEIETQYINAAGKSNKTFRKRNRARKRSAALRTLSNSFCCRGRPHKVDSFMIGMKQIELFIEEISKIR
jgi:hypothetical protein